MNAKTLLFKLLQDLAGSRFAFEVELITNYSGRGMYGQQCCGIVVSQSCSAVALGAGIMLMAYEKAFREEKQEIWYVLHDLHSLLETTVEDQMGHNKIYYWPTLNSQDCLTTGKI